MFGAQYEIATEQNLFRLMTLTSEERTVQETNYMTKDDRSFVGVCASTEFASDALLDSAVYGNADVLLSLLRSMGRELVPVKTLEFKGFKKYEIDAEKERTDLRQKGRHHGRLYADSCGSVRGCRHRRIRAPQVPLSKEMRGNRFTGERKTIHE